MENFQTIIIIHDKKSSIQIAPDFFDALEKTKLGKDNEAIRRSVGILTETPGLYDRLTAWENLVFFARL